SMPEVRLLRGLRLPRASAPYRLEQADACRDGHVQAFHLALHRDAHQDVATLAGEPAHALALRAEHPGDRFGKVLLVQRLLRALVGTDHPDVALLDLGE